jgi:hypothetical protein
MAKEDVALIAGNLLGVGKRVKEKNPNAKQSRKTGRKVKEAVQRLGQKKDKSAAEVTLLERARAKPLSTTMSVARSGWTGCKRRVSDTMRKPNFSLTQCNCKRGE